MNTMTAPTPKMEDFEIIQQIHRMKNEERQQYSSVIDIRTIDDLSGIDGVEVVKGDAVGPTFADDVVPVFRDVQIKLAGDHPLRKRMVKVFSNFTVLTPLALSDDGQDAPELSKAVNGTWFSVPTEKDGDKHVQWMPNSLKSINQAKALFNEYLAQGMIPHRVDPATGLAGTEVMREFDPSAGEVMFMDMKVFVAG